VYEWMIPKHKNMHGNGSGARAHTHQSEDQVPECLPLVLLWSTGARYNQYREYVARLAHHVIRCVLAPNDKDRCTVHDKLT
jgi:hypothetical protein